LGTGLGSLGSPAETVKAMAMMRVRMESFMLLLMVLLLRSEGWLMQG
jgi:hypothetical protein